MICRGKDCDALLRCVDVCKCICFSGTCDLGDPLQSGDGEGHSHPEVGPYKQQTVTDQQAAH